jgi:hypothetical protein
MERRVSFEEVGGAGVPGVPAGAPYVSNDNYQCMTVPGGNADEMFYSLLGPVGSQRVKSIDFKIFRDGGGDRDFSSLIIWFNNYVNGTMSIDSAHAKCFKEDVETHSRLAVSVGQVKRGKDRIVCEREHLAEVNTRVWQNSHMDLEYPWV